MFLCSLYFLNVLFDESKRQNFYNRALVDFNRTLFILQFGCREIYLGKRLKEHFEEIAVFLAHKKMENFIEIKK